MPRQPLCNCGNCERCTKQKWAHDYYVKNKPRVYARTRRNKLIREGRYTEPTDAEFDARALRMLESEGYR